MEIRRRIGYPRSYFHVMNRGARKVSIFADETDRRIFRGLLGRFAEKYSVRILAWCLMPNHYHLEPDAEGTPLSRMMRDLDATYARSFNARHQTEGCLFQGPFKSILIRDLDGLAYVNRYIHLNPVDLGQVPGSYPWSSCGVYLGVDPKPAWMDLAPVSQVLAKPTGADPENYAFYLQKGLERRKVKKWRKSANEIGDFYTEWIRHLEERCSEKVLDKMEALGRLTLSTLVTWFAHRIHGVPAAHVAAFYGYGSAHTVRSICSRVQHRLEEDSSFKAALESVVISPTHK